VEAPVVAQSPSRGRRASYRSTAPPLVTRRTQFSQTFTSARDQRHDLAFAGPKCARSSRGQAYGPGRGGPRSQPLPEARLSLCGAARLNQRQTHRALVPSYVAGSQGSEPRPDEPKSGRGGEPNAPRLHIVARPRDDATRGGAAARWPFVRRVGARQAESSGGATESITHPYWPV
jgi:hypothetical protein